MKRKIISWLMLLLPLNLILAQETHWQCNIYDFQYDMTSYLDVTVDGNAISDYSNYEVAAFCGEECRGLASLEEIPNTEKKYYYLRIRSNQNEGETISFKVYDKAKAKEYSIAARTVTFSAQSMQGYPSSPMVLSAANCYRLIYVLDGVEYSTDSIAYGTELVQKEALTKEGHTFSGWSEIPATMPAQDVTVEGSFTVNSYRLVYLLDGAEYSVDSIAYGTELVQKESLTKEGHTFSGWSEIPATMPAQDVTVEGSFTVNSYRLVYLLDGAEYSVDSIAYGTVLVQKEALAKEGHTFSGWSEIPVAMPARDVTVEGKFAVNSYRLVYLLDGVEYSVDSITYGTEMVQKEALTKEGHTFSGWSEIPATMPAQDVTVEGSFTVNSYRLVYLLNGAEYSTDSIAYGTELVQKDALVKEGYTFSGWSEIPVTMPAQDVTVEGTFTVNCYRLVYLLDGVEYFVDSIAYGTELVQKESLTKEGHTFSGWSEIPATMPAQDVTVEGSFTVNSYRLVYLLDGVEYSVDSIAYGTELVQKEALTKEGHTFSGWSEIPATMPAQDVTVEGSFTVNSFRLVYLLDGAEYSVDSIAYGTELVLKESLTKEGHTFSGWSEIPATMPADDVTIEGKFTVNSYRLVYLLDGAEYSVDSIAYGTELVQKESLTKEGHTFSDWSEIPATMPAQDVTVEGTFTINRYTLLYMVDGAEYKKVELEYGANIIAEAIPAKEGHTFSGWSEIPATMPAQDVTVTGSFTVNSYTITYRVDGEVYATEEVAYGEVIVLKEAPEKDGYIFSGWSEVPETMPAEDLEVTGSFASSIKAVITKTHVDVYSLQGMLLKRQILVDELKNELPQGIYIVDGKKVLVK